MPAFGPLNCGNSTLDHRLHLLEGARLNLPHSLARDAEFVGEHSKRDWVFGQAPRFEDPALANVEFRGGLDQRLAPIFQLFVLDQDALLARRAPSSGASGTCSSSFWCATSAGPLGRPTITSAGSSAAITRHRPNSWASSQYTTARPMERTSN